MATENAQTLVPGVIVRGPLFPEPVEIITVVPMGSSIKLIGKGLKSRKAFDPVLTTDQLDQLEVSPVEQPFDGDPVRFRLGVEAARLSLAYEYDPYFSLSISRIDPLPHQLEAVYEYFLSLQVRVHPPNGVTKQELEATRIALRELGISEDVDAE